MNQCCSAAAGSFIPWISVLLWPAQEGKTDGETLQASLSSLYLWNASTQHNAPKIYVWKYPGVPVVNTALLVQGAQVQSLAKELRFHILHSTAKKKKIVFFFFNSV